MQTVLLSRVNKILKIKENVERLHYQVMLIAAPRHRVLILTFSEYPVAPAPIATCPSNGPVLG